MAPVAAPYLRPLRGAAFNPATPPAQRRPGAVLRGRPCAAGRPVGRRDGGIFREERFKVLDATAFIGVGDPQQPCNSLTDESRNAVACRVVAIALALLKPKHLIDLDLSLIHISEPTRPY